MEVLAIILVLIDFDVIALLDTMVQIALKVSYIFYFYFEFLYSTFGDKFVKIKPKIRIIESICTIVVLILLNVLY